MKVLTKTSMLCMAFLIAAASVMAGGNKPFKISTKYSSGGSITPRTANAHVGEVKVFSVKPDLGFRVVSVEGCSGLWDANSMTYTTSPATGDCEISATFHYGTNLPPQVNAGIDQIVSASTTVNLSGSALDVDGSIASLRWTQTGGPVRLFQADQYAADVSFLAPVIPVDGVFTFEFSAVDNEGAVASDVVQVTVLHTNTPPMVNAGQDQTVSMGSAFALSGSALDSDGAITSISWVQVGGPQAVLIGGAGTLNPSYLAPNVSVSTPLTFNLVCTDNEGAASLSSVHVTVLHVNQPPIVAMGGDLVVNAKDSVSLSASAVDTDGTIASVQWRQTGGPGVVLGGDVSLNPLFTAPDVAADSVLSFSVSVTDNDGAVSVGTQRVTVKRVNKPPVVSAGIGYQVNSGDVISLTGTASDPDGVVISTSWSCSSDLISFTNSSSLTQLLSAPSVLQDTNFSFVFSATDNEGAKSSSSVNMLVKYVNKPPVISPIVNQSVNAGAVVVLSAMAQDPDGTISKNWWEQLSGPMVSLSLADSASASFVAPNGIAEVTLTFRFYAQDNQGSIASQDTAIRVLPQIISRFVQVGSLLFDRPTSSAAKLKNGDVFVYGGWGYGVRSQLYSADLQTFSSFGVEDYELDGSSATLLSDGKVLIAGGMGVWDAQYALTIYDPEQKTFARVGTMLNGRGYHSAVLLQDGRVMFVGGTYAGYSTSNIPVGGPQSAIEIYDPADNSVALLGHMLVPRSEQFAAILPDGRVMVFGGDGGASGGGYLSSTEIIDPKTGSIIYGPSLDHRRSGIMGTVLPDGNILVFGGNLGMIDGGPFSDKALVYNVSQNSFTQIESILTPRGAASVVSLANGDVIISGGMSLSQEQWVVLDSVDRFDVKLGIFVSEGRMNFPRKSHHSILLNDGSVLFIGGAGLNCEVMKPLAN